jgi:hypothetical protein
MVRVKAMANPRSQPRDVPRVSTIELIFSVTDA